MAILLIAISLSASEKGPSWTYLGNRDYRLIAGTGNGLPIVFNALQEQDKTGIVEAVEKEPGIEDKWAGSRPDIIPPLEFRKVLGNALADIKTESFEFPYEDLDGKKTAKIVKLYQDGRESLAPEDPECAGFEIIPLPNNTRYMLPTIKGLWLVDSREKNAVKISKDTFDGKPYDQLKGELWQRSAGDGSALLWWNDNPVSSADGSKIAYTTNRDCIARGGNSIWLYDLDTGEERVLISNTSGENYRCKAWVGSSCLIYQRFIGDTSDYFAADVTESSTRKLQLKGGNPDLLAVHPRGVIAYTPDSSTCREIYAAMLDETGEDAGMVYEKSIQGTLRDPYCFSVDGTKLAYLYAPDNNGTTQDLTIVDLESGKETTVKGTTKGQRSNLHDFNWLDNNRLLIHTSTVVDNQYTIYSWIYNLKRR